MLARSFGAFAWVTLACALAAPCPPAAAQSARIAVAANFTTAAKGLAAQFARESGRTVALASGSTGKLFAQIRGGAPFDALLAADDETPARLEAEGFAVPGSRFTYATGRLVLWSARQGVVDDAGAVLRDGRFARLAIANPRLAPYGAAARQTLERLGVWQSLQDRLVRGESIAQAYQFVASGNADLGFVAWSQVRSAGGRGSAWLVPEDLHPPLRQEAVLLTRGAANDAARGFLAYLRSPGARQRIRAYGYETP